MRRAAALLLLCACALPERDVLSRATFSSCEEALQRGRVGELCTGLGKCERGDGCCREALVCTNGIITSLNRDCSACPSCTHEANCATKSWCVGGRCEPCPAVDCPPCEKPFVQLVRNGCATCECGPPSSCEACAGPEVCQPGLFCLEGCTGPECCVQRCALPVCATPNPEGCDITCDGTTCATCVAQDCQCAGGTWLCTKVCAPQLTVWAKRCHVD